MNNPKYDGVFYPVREVNDLKEIITSSAELFADKTAYLEKDKKAGKFMPVYGRLAPFYDRPCCKRKPCLSG